MASALYIDAFNGIAGDMLLAALLDLGVQRAELVEGLSSLGLEAFQLHTRQVERQGLRGLDLHIEYSHKPAGKDHSTVHAHDAPARNLTQILQLIEYSRLPEPVKLSAGKVFRRLGQAEAEVHGTSIEEVHFHEVGALDSIIDIVGSCLALHLLEIRSIFSSPLALGGGTVQFSHGNWPVPAPATERLVRGFPCRMGPVDSELTTPTGAALVTSLGQPVKRMPAAIPLRSGLGAGDKKFDQIPNMLRVILFETEIEDRLAEPLQEEEISVLEASIDNMDPESLADFQDLALSQGALDVYYSSLHMKKGRPGVLLTILCCNGDRDRLASLVFKETTTLGLRWEYARRWVLDRESIQVETDFGPITVKLGRLGRQVVNVWPEYKELRQLATARGIPFKLARRKVFEALKELKYE